jgi:metal iron transporter
MLIAPQVVVSIMLPFTTFPLICLTSSRTAMRVCATAPAVRAERKDDVEEQDVVEDEYLDFSNEWIVSGIGYVIGTVIVIANSYLLITVDYLMLHTFLGAYAA